MAIDQSATQLSELIASIYDRAIDPRSWQESLGRIRGAFGAEMAALGLIDLRARRLLMAYADNVPQEWLARLAPNAGEMIDLWGGDDFIRSAPMDEPFLARDRTEGLTKGKNTYRDEALAKGYIDAMALGLARDDHVMGSCLLGRIRGTPQFESEELQLARLLLPHLQRTIEFSRMFELANLRAEAFETALEATAVPTILVSSGSEVIHANSAGHAALERGNSLRVVAGRISGANLASQTGLARAMEVARDRPDAHPRHLDVELESGSGALKLLPLPRNTERGLLVPSATAAIVLTGSRGRNRRDDEAIAEILINRHGLTRAEAAVALEVAKGDGRAAAAGRLGLREATVRTHLSAIFLKLDINRQGQLVRLIEHIADRGPTS